MAMETNDINNSAIIIVVPKIRYNKNERTTPILGDPIKRQWYDEDDPDTYHNTKMNEHGTLFVVGLTATRLWYSYGLEIYISWKWASLGVIDSDGTAGNR